MAKSISQLTTQATANDTDLFEVAIADQNSASGYASKKESAETIAQGIVGNYTYPLLMPNMQAKTITGAINQLLANFAAVYDSTATYAVGDICTHNGQLYKCNTEINTPEAFDSTKWDAGTADDFFEGGGGTEPPQIIDYDREMTCSTKGSYTTKSFTLKKNDVIIIGVYHRSVLTTPTGFTVFKQMVLTPSETMGSYTQYLTVLTYTAAASENKSVTIQQADSSARLGVFAFQIRNASIIDANVDYSYHTTNTGGSGLVYTIAKTNNVNIVFIGIGYTIPNTSIQNISPNAEVIFWHDTSSTGIDRFSAILDFGSFLTSDYTYSENQMNTRQYIQITGISLV